MDGLSHVKSRRKHGLHALWFYGLGLAWLALGFSACLVPPEGEPPATLENIPPEADLESMRPYAPQTAIPVDRCSDFRVELSQIIDLDSPTLHFRWVANNRLPRARWLRDFDLSSTRKPGEPHRAFARVVPSLDFPDQVEQARNKQAASGVLSLFVTDAPGWEIPSPITPQAEPQDLGRVPSIRRPGQPRPAVVEFRWTFVFGQEGECQP